MPGFGVWAARWWMPILFVVIAGHLTNVCVTLFLHRAQTHRGVRLHYLAALPMRLWLWLTTAIVTKEWVACHRKHHAYADREGDPHSPLLEGLRNIVFKGAFYYRKAIRQPGMLEKYGKGTPNDWIERHILSRLNWVGILVMFLIDVYLFGFFVGPIVWGAQMLWIPFWAAGIVNGVGHALGYRNFQVKDESRNITPIAIWLGGEELHNNHHADPKSARFAARWFEFDIGWVYIRTLSALKLARIRKVAPKLRRSSAKTVPDLATLQAVITHRYHVATDYARSVKAACAAELQALRERAHRGEPRNVPSLARLKRWLTTEPEALADADRADMAHALEGSQKLAKIVAMRAELSALWARSTETSEQLLVRLQDWCHRAEASGIDALAQFSLQLRRYA